jgi:hypothetical protein
MDEVGCPEPAAEVARMESALSRRANDFHKSTDGGFAIAAAF